MHDLLQIEVVFALPEKQHLTVVSVPAGTTVGEAVEAAGIADKFPDVDVETLPTGIWGRPASRQAAVKEGDRVELYRPLLRDPREARRELAQAGLTMRGADDEDQG